MFFMVYTCWILYKYMYIVHPKNTLFLFSKDATSPNVGARSLQAELRYVRDGRCGRSAPYRLEAPGGVKDRFGPNP